MAQSTALKTFTKIEINKNANNKIIIRKEYRKINRVDWTSAFEICSSLTKDFSCSSYTLESDEV